MKYDELVETLEEYIELLCDEIDELAGIASVHGWESSRYEQGVELRERINKLKITTRNEKT